MFIRAVTTVVVTITHPHFRDTPVVIAGEVVGSTGGRETSGTVHFIRTVTAVVHAVTAPTGQDAVLVVAGECSWRAGHSWISAVGLISLIYAIDDSVTAVGVGPTASFITLKG